MYNINDIVITHPILGAISQIDEFKGFEKAQPQPDQAASQNFCENILKESSLMISDPIERKDYIGLVEQILFYYKDIDFHEMTIKKFHKKLMQNSLVEDKEKGQYKTILNHIFSHSVSGQKIDVLVETAGPFETPHLMQKLVEQTRIFLQDRTYHPLLIIGVFMLHFLLIHPFSDGNSRLSRALTMLLLLQNGYEHLKYASLEIVIEENKDEYYRCLRHAQEKFRDLKPDYSEWLLFFLRSIQRMQNSIRIHQKLSGDYHKLPLISAQIMSLCDKQERLTLKDAVAFSGANINTVKKHLASLVAQGLLEKFGSSRGTWYSKA